ncbi:hypothetical protein RIF29_34793 [Crotalaria pallida]|uniref:Uncharacterized protein n=1 Tax=Crotalaria pallida TaxID=3830 RepID=A0AAN9E9P9_CROPI
MRIGFSILPLFLCKSWLLQIGATIFISFLHALPKSVTAAIANPNGGLSHAMFSPSRFAIWDWTCHCDEVLEVANIVFSPTIKLNVEGMVVVIHKDWLMAGWGGPVLWCTLKISGDEGS